MQKRNNNRLRALRLTLPVMCGYLFLGTAFGAVLAQAGFGPAWALAASTLVYAGSLQFVMVPLMAAGTSLIVVALTALMVNARHLFYGLAMLDRFRGLGWKKLYLIFGMCDETFSVTCSTRAPEGVDEGWFMTFVTLLDQLYWVLGAALGGLFGSLLTLNTEGLDFVMTAMFVVIFLENWLKEENHTSSLLGLGLPLVGLVLFGAQNFILPSMAAILLALTALRVRLEKGGNPA